MTIAFLDRIYIQPCHVVICIFKAIYLEPQPQYGGHHIWSRDMPWTAFSAFLLFRKCKFIYFNATRIIQFKFIRGTDRILFRLSSRLREHR